MLKVADGPDGVPADEDGVPERLGSPRASCSSLPICQYIYHILIMMNLRSLLHLTL